jgi:tetratricopeptide (TPR) repeat protein
MKRLLVCIFSLLSVYLSFAQDHRNAGQLYATAKEVMRQGDYENAAQLLDSALKLEPGNLAMLQDLSFVNYLEKDYAKSIEISKTLIERPDADEQTFQLLGMSYKAIAEYKDCDKLYRNALKRFPHSGVLYNEMGELLALNHNIDGAIIQWEKGIEVSPDYSSNYFNAANYYAKNNNLFRELIYGEIFLNLESYSTRSADMKGLLLEGYQKLYSGAGITGHLNGKKGPDFEQLFFETLSKSSNIALDGITPENLTAIRTRFILDWFGTHKEVKLPFYLFSHLRYLLREGLFEAYNQWIFGAANSPSAYEVWIDTHDKQAAAFKQFQQSRVFKLPAGQYYH